MEGEGRTDWQLPDPTGEEDRVGRGCGGLWAVGGTLMECPDKVLGQQASVPCGKACHLYSHLASSACPVAPALTTGLYWTWRRVPAGTAGPQLTREESCRPQRQAVLQKGRAR